MGLLSIVVVDGRPTSVLDQKPRSEKAPDRLKSAAGQVGLVSRVAALGGRRGSCVSGQRAVVSWQPAVPFASRSRCRGAPCFWRTESCTL